MMSPANLPARQKLLSCPFLRGDMETASGQYDHTGPLCNRQLTKMNYILEFPWFGFFFLIGQKASPFESFNNSAFIGSASSSGFGIHKKYCHGSSCIIIKWLIGRETCVVSGSDSLRAVKPSETVRLGTNWNECNLDVKDSLVHSFLPLFFSSRNTSYMPVRYRCLEFTLRKPSS